MLCSAMLASRPFFKPTPCCALLKSIQLYPSTSTITVKNDMQSQKEATPDEWTLLHGSMHEMRNLTDQVTYHNTKLPSNTSNRINAAEIMDFSKTRTSIEHRLLSLLPLRDPMKISTDCLFEACRLGSLIFINCVLREFSPKIGVLKTLKGQLIGMIQGAEHTCVDLGAKLHLSRLVWVLMMGGILSLNSQEETWFAERIARAMAASGLETWEDVEQLLYRIGWAKALRNSACKSLWRRVEEIKRRGLDARLPYFDPDCPSLHLHEEKWDCPGLIETAS